MSNYGITGWSGGPRQSLTHNLRAGQFRGMGRTNIFPSTTVVNNNFFGNGYGIYDDCCCNNNNSTPSWMNWMMGIGLGTSLLGNILGMFGIGGGGGGVSDTEGGGGSEKSTKTTKETKEVSKLEQAQNSLNTLGFTKEKGYNVWQDPDGNLVYTLTDKDGKEYKAKTFHELQNMANTKKSAQPATTTTAKDTTAKETLPRLFNDETMKGYKTEEEVLQAFKTATGAYATKISDISADNITLGTVEDKGNGTTMAGNLKIPTAKLKAIEPGKSENLGTFKGKAIIAENLDGYIRVKIGNKQTYIVGKAQNGSYKGFQADKLNVTGTGDANWTGRS